MCGRSRIKLPGSGAVGFGVYPLPTKQTRKETQAGHRYRRRGVLPGDYQRGLKLTDKLRRGRSKTSAYWLFRGKMLYQLGQLSDAESCLRSGLALESETRMRVLALEDLGRVQMEQQRYEEAVRSFEASIEIARDAGSGHRAIAELWLRQGIREAEALNFALMAVENARNSRASASQIQSIQLAEALATLAWAVAVHSGEAAEVERLVNEAIPLCGDDRKPTLAHLHYLAGAAYSVLGTIDGRDQCAHHFKEAAATDSQGIFGRLAKAAVHGAAA